MSKKVHPLILKTKLELESLDKNNEITWGERKSYTGSLLAISVEPNLRPRALSFMNELITLLENNSHSIKFEYGRCYIEMYGQLTQINLRQKYYRVRVKVDNSYSHNTFVKSDDLEFQIGYSYRTGWIDKKAKKIENYLQIIYDHIESKSKYMFDWRELQRKEEEAIELQRKIEKEEVRLIAVEKAKIDTLIMNASDYKKANEIRTYLIEYDKKSKESNEDDQIRQDYINWGFKIANKIDPLFSED
jgi:hypothetical protein